LFVHLGIDERYLQQLAVEDFGGNGAVGRDSMMSSHDVASIVSEMNSDEFTFGSVLIVVPDNQQRV